ncbi:hypothetical protein BGZ60DRAFT_560192 [Tricladium varicosporioides]|nr:hypothetical protein BGZ60DRAFT_560192 [Hymenoscyphus varicosporioides]
MIYSRGILEAITAYTLLISVLAIKNQRDDDYVPKENGMYNLSPSSPSSPSSSYEYVIVGSGPGGGTLAARLAIAGYKVLLIDAGNDQGSSHQEQVPALQFLSTEYDPMKWSYYVNHFPNSALQQEDSHFTWETPSGEYHSGPNPPQGSKPRGVLYTRAGTLGGCSAHNALITIVPHDSDWDNIAQITSDSSWKARNMRKYFERLERNEYLPKHARGHGREGWLRVNVFDLNLIAKDSIMLALITAAARTAGKTVNSVINSAFELSQLFNDDVNSPGQIQKEDLYQIPIATTNGKRNGPRDFILETANAVNPNGSRKYHLDIRLNTLVTKIKFDRSGYTPRAIGVDYLEGIGLYRASAKSVTGPQTGSGSVFASKEVIVSAGPYNTPQLLKLSGIGPKSELDYFKIPIVVNLPGVGSNLQDRYETSVITKTPTPFKFLEGCSFLNTSPDLCLEKWKNGRNASEKGVYTGPGVGFGILKKSSVAENGNGDLFILGGPVAFSGYFPGFTKVENLLPGGGTIGWWSWIVLKAHSRNNAGKVTLRSTDPLDMPVVNFNSFEYGVTANNADEKDLQALYEGVDFARQINRNLIPIDKSFTEVFPGPNITTEAATKAFIKKEAFGHHASCTCPIGPDSDPMAVLDSRFRVRGVKGLRVVDASVFPKIPGFYIAVPTYMISEKAADVIVEDEKAGAY